VLVLQVTVDGLGAADNLALGLLAREVLGEQASVRVGVITANHNKAIKVELDCIVKRVCELLRRLNLVTSRT